ncbi:GNAT family acetyltransferase [Agrilactobacillus composti DSM 18527 = JCM 14202]|uniref:GNAT family acetyltransferase n=1 Tax=Agrilactobacillus composti DSM 18527 = JCM 14202 TaxID=1423734 RepID=X0PGK9_9LACO|nr:GNAT family N-acetyltransferase [Agrilactobacillus composti]KRM34648.1 GNAT family acetyltransferase [Agrilactobacillus composti DSM 18527 = JCM 14202]GAF41184.1 acetyltransferase, GNAT family [Agrilactobacillus composti DSM 18527 = JCM 14202]
MIQIQPIQNSDNVALTHIVRQALKAYQLDIPGTAYFDPELSDLSSFYQASSKRQYFVAKSDNGVLLGGNGIAEYDMTNQVAELQKLYLIQSARGHHLSYQLLDAAISFAKGAGYKKVYLETHHNLKAAIHTYHKYGFTELDHPLNKGTHSAMDRFFVISI